MPAGHEHRDDRSPLPSPRSRQPRARRVAPRRAGVRAGRGRWVDVGPTSPQSCNTTRFPGPAEFTGIGRRLVSPRVDAGGQGDVRVSFARVVRNTGNKLRHAISASLTRIPSSLTEARCHEQLVDNGVGRADRLAEQAAVCRASNNPIAMMPASAHASRLRTGQLRLRYSGAWERSTG